MWAVDKDPALRSDFCNLTVLERVPEPSRVDATLARALGAIPRLGQRVVSAPLRIVPPEFSDDPTLDLAYHVRRASVARPGDMRALLAACAAAAEAPLDRSRPLWEFTIFEGLADGRAAVLQKVHHTISDGVGGLRLSLALLDLEPDPDDVAPVAPLARVAPPTANVRTSPFDVARAAVGEVAARTARVAAHGATAAAASALHPSRIAGGIAGMARMGASIRRQLLVTDRARSDVMRARSLRRRFDVHTIPLGEVRATAKRLGGSVNDVYVAGLAVALGRYHARAGSDVRELRMAMPVSTRSRGEAAANRFVPTRVLVPIQPADDPEEVFGAVRDRLGATRSEPALGAAEGLAGAASGLPTSVLVALARAQTRTTDFAATNLRGSPVPLYLAGRRIVANYAFGPRTGTALNVTAIGYCDELHLGLNVDPAAIADVETFLADVDAAFGQLLS